ncbi:cation transporter [Prolixibacteraceae bacterium]|nr:cation transporter [Prolixibacteraceae bacterium]
MKIVKSLLPLFLMFVFLSPIMAKREKNIETVTFLCSIDCYHCKKKIMKNIPFEKGVVRVIVSIESKEVQVSFKKDKTDREKLEEAIEKLGYDAEVKKPCCTEKKK